MVTINVDGKTYEVFEADNLLKACLSVGIEIPYFCYHPALGSVGACRQCAVKIYKDENDTSGKIVMSCMQPVTEGMLVSVDDPEVVSFRAQVIESLMLNHPHDCPICDEGGECHLQDMTVMTGHTYRRNRFPKRTYRNQYLGPFINHEMNRCIQCYRCVRFYKDYAGGGDLDAFGISNHVYFGRHEEGPLENEFSGNLVEICPTGVFTDKTLKQHYTRKWDLTTAPSVCNHCGLGCNIIPGERYGMLRRIRSRYNHEVNGYFICDRGRFGYEFVNNLTRLRHATKQSRETHELEKEDQETLLDEIRSKLNLEKTIGIGSPRASMEANFALKELVGAENFCTGFSRKEHQLMARITEILKNRPVHISSLKETEQSDCVVILGEDVTQYAPMLGLSLRQTKMTQARKFAVRNNIEPWKDDPVRELYQDAPAPIYNFTPHATKLDDVSRKNFRMKPDDISRFAVALASKLDKDVPAPEDIPAEWENVIEELSQTLQNAEKPLIIAGTGSGEEGNIKAAADLAQILYQKNQEAGIFLTVPEANSMGLALLGGKSIEEIPELEKGKGAGHLMILENDLYRREKKENVDHILSNSDAVTVLDYLENDTTQKADYILPSAPFAEASGTFVNNEGRAQRFYKVYVPEDDIRESWRWLRDLDASGDKLSKGTWKHLDDCVEALAKSHATFEEIKEIAPPSGYRMKGQKIPRAPHRYSGRTAMHAHINVREKRPPEDQDSPLSFSMEGSRNTPPSTLTGFYWSPGWNSPQAINKYQIEVGGHLHDGDPGRRLLHPEDNTDLSFYKEIPEQRSTEAGTYTVISVHHIFGSEELSAQSASVKQRIPKPYVSMNKSEAEKIGAEENSLIIITIKGQKLELPMKVDESMVDGVVGIPTGLPGVYLQNLPATGRLSIKEKGRG